MASISDFLSRIKGFARSNREILLIAAATTALLILPDVIFHFAGYQTAAIFKQESMLLAGVLGLALTLIHSRRLRLAALMAVLASQALWFGCLAFFGRPLGPEQVLLAGNEMGDITAGIIDSWRVLLPPLALIAIVGGLITLLQRREIPHGKLRGLVGGYLFAMLMLGCAGYWLTKKQIVASIPGAQTFSGLGPFQATVAAGRLLMTPVKASPGMKIADQAVKPLTIEEDPTTVVVIMGEGISPTRLSLFGFERETTPRIQAWRTAPPPGFELISKIGFSGGVSTFGSVPAFIKMAYWPVEAEWRGVNLFDLAHRSGFKSWFFSAQSRHFLDVAGGARGAERVVTDQGNVDKLAARHDDFLVDLAREIPKDAKRRFVFFHQRVNHSNYLSHCSHLPAQEQLALYIFDAGTKSTNERRQNAYDNGTRCWDRNVAEIAAVFTGSPGAVHILAVSDHNEMMGEHGMWGHSQLDLRVSQIPVLLLTNRPQSEFAKRVRALSPPTWYELSALVARALGHEVTAPGAQAGRFYLNTTMPFGRSGYFEAETLGSAKFKARRYSSNGQLQNESVVDLPELGAANGMVSDPAGQTPTPN